MMKHVMVTKNMWQHFSSQRMMPCWGKLLKRAQKGSAWLGMQHNLYLGGKRSSASDASVGETFDSCSGIETQLRDIYAYQTCISGPRQEPPGDSATR